MLSLNIYINIYEILFRYHVDEPQKFGHLQPGLPSSKLREALRLREDQVPEYIYRMRALGYPPGWLLHAEINSSGIQLYHERYNESQVVLTGWATRFFF